MPKDYQVHPEDCDCETCSNPNDSEDAEDEPNSPDEGDWTTSDYGTFYEFAGKARIVVPFTNLAGSKRASWRGAVAARMEADQFWPNVWFLGERGGYELLCAGCGRYAKECDNDHE